MPSIKTIEARLPVADVSRFAVQLGRKETADSERHAACAVWIDVEELVALHAKGKELAEIEWGPEVYFYGRREFGA